MIVLVAMDGHASDGGGGVFGEAVLERVAAECSAGAGREQRVVGVPGALCEPGAQDRDGLLGQRRDPLLAALAQAVDVRAGAEVDVAALQCGQLGCAQPGLGGEQQHRVVAPAGPGGAVGCGEQRVDLGFGEERDERPLEALGWDREDAADRGGVLGVLERRVVKQRADRGQAGVAGADAVAAFVLEMVEERADQRRVEIVDVQLAGLLAGPLLGEREQQPQRVAVGRDRVRAGVALPESVGR